MRVTSSESANASPPDPGLLALVMRCADFKLTTGGHERFSRRSRAPLLTWKRSVMWRKGLRGRILPLAALRSTLYRPAGWLDAHPRAHTAGRPLESSRVRSCSRGSRALVHGYGASDAVSIGMLHTRSERQPLASSRRQIGAALMNCILCPCLICERRYLDR